MTRWCCRAVPVVYRNAELDRVVREYWECGEEMRELRRLWWHDWACPIHDPNKRPPAYWRILVRGLRALVWDQT